MGIGKKIVNKVIVQPAKNKAAELVQPGRAAAASAKASTRRKALLKAGKCPDNPPGNKHQFQGRSGDLRCMRCEEPFKR